MKEDFERYQRLLQEWNAGSEPQSKSDPPKTSSQGMNSSAASGPGTDRPRVKLAPTPGAEEPGRFPGGTILCLDDSELVVYRRPVKDQPYDMVYSLLTDG